MSPILTRDIRRYGGYHSCNNQQIIDSWSQGQRKPMRPHPHGRVWDKKNYFWVSNLTRRSFIWWRPRDLGPESWWMEMHLGQVQRYLVFGLKNRAQKGTEKKGENSYRTGSWARGKQLCVGLRSQMVQSSELEACALGVWQGIAMSLIGRCFSEAWFFL